MNTQHITLKPAETSHNGQRVDQYLSQCLPDLSRSRVQKLIADGHVSMADGSVLKNQRQTVAAGDVFQIYIPPAEPLSVKAQNIPLDILYEDNHLIVLNKSADIAVHPAPGNWDGTLVNALLYHCKGQLSGIGGVERPGIVHRLDLGTSGVMVVAKTDLAHQHLSKQFADRTIERRYLAFCYGTPTPRSGTIRGNIGRMPNNRKKMTVVKTGGKAATTCYLTQEIFYQGAFSLVELKLLTGRTHQIRVHMTQSGHPLLGDPMYGRARQLGQYPAELGAAIKSLGHQALHAKSLGFTHPESGQWIEFESNFPPDMAALLSLLQG